MQEQSVGQTIYIKFIVTYLGIKGGRVGIWAPRPLGPKEIDGQLVPSGKAYTRLTDHLISG